MNRECLFCQIAGGQTKTEFVYQDDTVVVFKDIHPQAPVHLLIVPRQHIRSVNELGEQESTIIARVILKGKEMAKAQGIAASGYKLLFNVERGGGQMIFHLHLHLIGGW